MRQEIIKRGPIEVKERSSRLKWGVGICALDKTQTTVWKPPFTDLRKMGPLQGRNQTIVMKGLFS